MNPIAEHSWHQTIDNALSRLDADLAVKWYLFALLASALAYLALTPIGSGDTDLWYHLNGGRLLAESGELPRSAFFSFTEAPGEWVNYFWGFQAFVYQVYTLAGYEGLLVLRVVLVGITIVAISMLLIRNTDTPMQRAWALALLVLVLLVLMGRIALIRPHLVSYMMISVFLLILEYRREWLPVLPLLTVPWVNMHGVEWVVGAAVCGAYFSERLWHWYRSGKPMDPDTRSTILWTLLCLPALLVNPFVFKILSAPFSTPSDIYAYIVELRTLPLTTLVSPAISGAVISVSGAIGILFFGNLLAYGLLILRGRMRLAPLVLGIVGMILLARGHRFIWEWLLLSLPLWRSAIDALREPSLSDSGGHVSAGKLLLLLLLVSPFATWAMAAKNTQSWPVHDEKLPIGVADFIQAQQIKGRLLTPPTQAGYLAWRLYPDVLISGDMQSPPTSPWTHFRVGFALNDRHALQRFVDNYQPELITIEFSKKGFSELIATQPGYHAVFFDDVFVLYANAKLLPDLVAEHALQHLNPHNLLDESRGDAEQRLQELQRVLGQYTNGRRVLHAITRSLIDLGLNKQALEYAQRFRNAHPEDPNSHFLTGNAFEHLDRCDEAIRHFEDAFAVAPLDFHSVLHRHIGSCAYVNKDFATAYQHFEKGINTYTDVAEPAHRFQFALSAVAVGEEEQARTLLQHLLYTVDPVDKTSINKAQALLSDL